MTLQFVGRALLVALGAFLLANAVLAWPELFFFAKVMFPPAWAQALPDPILGAWGVAAIAMLPLWPGRGDLAGVAYRFAAATSIGALVAGVAWYAGQGAIDPRNLVFQVAWVWGLHLLPPAMLMAALRVALHALRARSKPHAA